MSNSNVYNDIIVNLVNNSLTMFIGTGFSKYLTDGAAPNWLELLVECTLHLDHENEISDKLFIKNNEGKVVNSKLPLTTCAQILEYQYQLFEQDIRLKICEIINDRINQDTINFEKVDKLKEFFSKHNNINFITTNYDSLISDYVLPNKTKIFIEGTVIPKLNNSFNVYHIHGSILNQSSLILTTLDYYNFQNSHNYFLENSIRYYKSLQL